jgi:hypothetical protein
VAEPELRITREPLADANPAARRRARRHYDDDDALDLTPYMLALRWRWRALAFTAAAAAVVTAMLTGFVLPRWYRAKAVIRPIATPAVESRVAGLLGGLGGGLGRLNGVASMLGGGGSNDAAEYIAILRGFRFDTHLVLRHHLQDQLRELRLLDLDPIFGPGDQNWTFYRILDKHFDCDYSMRTGNLTLYFETKDRREAERILGYYIDDLREVLRARQVRDATAAIASLEQEARTTPDAVERTQLYELIARQVQLKKVAQVEADFAFRVLDPPAASDRRYRPAVLLDTVLVAILATLVASIAIALKAPK